MSLARTTAFGTGARKVLLFISGALLAVLVLGAASLAVLAAKDAYSSGFHNRKGRLYDQADQAMVSRIGIEVFYNEIAREGFEHIAFSLPGYSSIKGTTYDLCDDFGLEDGFGNGYCGIKFEMADDTPAATNLVVVTRSPSGDFSVMGNAKEQIAGKGIQFGKTVIFIWSSGPDGMNSFSGWDDITLL